MPANHQAKHGRWYEYGLRGHRPIAAVMAAATMAAVMAAVGAITVADLPLARFSAAC